MKLSGRIAASAAIGAWGAFIAWFGMTAAPHHLAKDFTWPWWAAQALLRGQDPYQVIQATGAYPHNAGLYYPLPAAVLALPLGPLPAALAGTLFVALSAAALGWALSREAPHRLFLCVSAPFCMASLLGQWSIILTAAALLPALQFVCAAKPTIGFAAWLYRPSWRGVIGGLALVLLSFLIMPEWVSSWREELRGASMYRAPALTLAGCFTLLALLRWRRREGRLYLGLSIAPQIPLFYDQLLLWLVPGRAWHTAVLTALSWGAWLVWFPARALDSNFDVSRPWILLLIYAPALFMLLALPAREDAPPPENTAEPGGPPPT